MGDQQHWHIWKSADNWGSGEAKAYFKLSKPYWSRSAANKAKASMVNIGSGNLPSLVLECKDAKCRVLRRHQHDE